MTEGGEFGIARRGGGCQLEARVAELEQRALATGETEAQFARLAELEERIDFAERLLAQRSEPRALEHS